ncbi:hypothetical protein [Fusobacterium sp. PH5-44]|uniref:hypothetical protein n=1 Tax=unclassified Fusobacterium TaxID=2648384 RepID=UPI003D23ED78
MQSATGAFQSAMGAMNSFSSLMSSMNPFSSSLSFTMSRTKVNIQVKIIIR